MKHKKILAQFTSTDNLYCIVTEKQKSPNSIQFALLHLKEKEYTAFIFKIGKGYYAVRELLPAEMKDAMFLRTHARYIIQQGDGSYAFGTKIT